MPAKSDVQERADGPALDDRRLAERGMTGWSMSNKRLYGYMLISAILSLTASWVLTYDAFELAKNPDTVFSCDINSVLSCGSVAQSWQAQLFGFPNSFLGMVSEPVVITIAVAGLAGVRFPRWFMLTAQFVYLLGLAFAYWLFWQSYTVIGALCPWCLLITLGTTLVFFTLLTVNVRDRNFRFAPATQARVDAFTRDGWLMGIAYIMLAVVVSLIIAKYGLDLFRL